MKRIGHGDRVFVIMSRKYLCSPFCMFELSEIWRISRQEGEAFLQRVRVYTLPDAKIRNRPIGCSGLTTGRERTTHLIDASERLGLYCRHSR